MRWTVRGRIAEICAASRRPLEHRAGLLRDAVAANLLPLAMGLPPAREGIIRQSRRRLDRLVRQLAMAPSLAPRAGLRSHPIGLKTRPNPSAFSLKMWRFREASPPGGGVGREPPRAVCYQTRAFAAESPLAFAWAIRTLSCPIAASAAVLPFGLCPPRNPKAISITSPAVSVRSSVIDV